MGKHDVATGATISIMRGYIFIHLHIDIVYIVLLE